MRLRKESSTQKTALRASDRKVPARCAHPASSCVAQTVDGHRAVEDSFLRDLFKPPTQRYLMKVALLLMSQLLRHVRETGGGTVGVNANIS